MTLYVSFYVIQYIVYRPVLKSDAFVSLDRLSNRVDTRHATWDDGSTQEQYCFDDYV